MAGTGKNRRDRLGRGLEALLGEYLGDGDSTAGEVQRLPVDAIAPNPFQPRREFSEEELAELTASIEENGLLQPIVVRPASERSGAADWELVAGERRWRAVTRIGWHDVPALVRELDDRALLVLALVENLQRASLSPLEEAEGYQRLAEDFELTQQEIARAVGRDRSTVANLVRLLQLPATIRRLVDAGRLSAGHARALLAVPDEGRRVDLARRAVDEGWSVREMETQVRNSAASKDSGDRTRKRERQRQRPAAERRLEEVLQRALGTPARIHKGRGAKGRIEIPFYSAEDFERVYELLVGRPAEDIVS